MVIRVKRAYAPPESDDGCRVLVDRLWPRGVSKRAARIDLWLKEIAPRTALRHWFGHDPATGSTFRARDFRELQRNGAAVEQLMAHARHGTVTLVYGTKDQEHHDAVGGSAGHRAVGAPSARQAPDRGIHTRSAHEVEAGDSRKISRARVA